MNPSRVLLCVWLALHLLTYYQREGKLKRNAVSRQGNASAASGSASIQRRT